jgi:hypothetical protein
LGGLKKSHKKCTFFVTAAQHAVGTLFRGRFNLLGAVDIAHWISICPAFGKQPVNAEEQLRWVKFDFLYGTRL